MWGRCPVAVEGKALSLPRGYWEAQSPAVCQAQLSQQSYDLPLHLSYRGLSIRRVRCTQLHSLEWPPQALICCLTVYPPSTAPAALYLSSTSPLRPSSPSHAILLASHPSGFIPTSLALWPQKHTSTHMPSFLSSSVVAYFAYFLCSLC